MAGYWTDLFSYISGAVRSSTMTYLAMVGDEAAEERVPQTLFVLWEPTEWFHCEARRWNLAGIAVAKQPIEQMIAIGEWGDVFCIGSGDEHDEHVASGQRGPKDRGPMRGVRRIGKRIYAVGMDRQVYRRKAANRWADIGPPTPAAQPADAVSGFEAIDGFDEKDIYAVGWDGEIWHYDGKKWRRLPSATNLLLVAVCCAGDGFVYASGREGLLLRGRDQQWEVIDLPGTTPDFWSLAWFDGRLYVSSMYRLFTFENGALAVVDTGAERAKTYHRLSAEDGVLWSIGAKDVLAFDGKTWTRID
jgi:hypothetical protein